MAIDLFDASTDSAPLTSGSGGRLVKVVTFDESGLERREYPSKQLTEDPFNDLYGATIKRPPYALEQLVLLAESHPIHSSCIEQKVADTIASGLNFVSRDPAGTISDKELTEAANWWESMFEDYTSVETLYAMEDDHETLGFGALEIGRDTKGEAKRLWHVPTHTLRVHKSGRLFVQIRAGRQRWFKAWGEPNNFRLTDGKPVGKDADPATLANEILIFKRPSRRSSWYSAPTYISALGHILLAIAARDYNITFFENAREPRYVYIVTGLDEQTVEDTIEKLSTYLRTQHREPHRNLLLPLTGENTKVQIERLTMQQNDMHFSRMMEMMDDSVLIAHRVPPDRLGLARRGFLGGTVANVVNRIYKDGVVARAQDLVEDRLDRFLRTEWARTHGGTADPTQAAESVKWRVDLEQVDIADEKVDTDIAVLLAKNSIISLNEARGKVNMPPREDFADLTLAEWLKEKGLSGGGGGAPGEGAPPMAASVDGYIPIGEFSLIRETQESVLRRIDDLDGYVEELLLGNGEHTNGHRRDEPVPV